VGYDRVKDDVEAKAFTALAAKGKTQPIEVFEILGLK
jgi:hypothetical protein